MHETAVIAGLLRILSEQAALHHVEKITRVRVKVGRLRAVEPQLLRGCFEIFSEGTLAEGAELIIDEVRVRGRCRACGLEFDVPRYRFECPDCHGSDISVLTGQELYIENFETVA
jgi:hydrogenase nickel incorporation protein HypA/HybF